MIQDPVCPVCRIPIVLVDAGRTSVHACRGCGGLWLDRATVDAVCANAERQADVLGMTLEPVPAVDARNARERPCPECSAPMHPVHFQRVSGVMLDVCGAHGTWFDRDELRRMIDFVQAGGAQVVFEQRDQEWRRERERLNVAVGQASAGRRPRQGSLLVELVTGVLESAVRLAYYAGGAHY
jgi:Zn-finger nucleic acid-binding protein